LSIPKILPYDILNNHFERLLTDKRQAGQEDPAALFGFRQMGYLSAEAVGRSNSSIKPGCGIVADFF
jgi:hypothetical protein